MVGVAASVTAESNDEEPWAVEIGYFTPDRYLLTVHTVRSAQGLSAYGLPVEDLPSAVVNFQLAAAARADSSHSGLAPDAAQEWIDEQRGAIQFTRAQVAATPPSPTALTVNHSTVSGIGVVLDGCVAVQLRWQRQTILCAGRPDLISDLTLAMVGPDHLPIH